MNKKVSVFSRVILALTFILAVASTALRVVMMKTYDFANGFYTDSNLHTIFRCSLIVFAVIAFAGAHIYIKEGKIQISVFKGKLTGVISFIPACAFIGFIAYMAARFVLPTMADPLTAELVMMLFSIFASLYFLSKGISGKSTDKRALLSISPALVLLALVFGLYFNQSVSYINHSVVLCYGASIFLMLSIAAEANAVLRRPYLHRYLSYAPVAVVLSFALSIPDIICAVNVAKAPITDIFYDILILALGIYHLAHLIVLAFCKATKED